MENTNDAIDSAIVEIKKIEENITKQADKLETGAEKLHSDAEKLKSEAGPIKQALEILENYKNGNAEASEVQPEVPETPFEVQPEVPFESEPQVPESPMEVQPESPFEAEPESPFEAEPESPMEVQPESPTEVQPENSTDTVIPPTSELKEIQDMNNENQQPYEEGFGETFNNIVDTTKDFFSPKKPENEVQKGGKRKNRKSRKGLRTKRFRGGNNKKTRKGHRNSRRLRK